MSDTEDEIPTKKPSKPKPSPLEKDKLKCPQCDSLVETYPSPESTYITLLSICLTIILFSIWSIFLLPFVIPLTKSIVFRCSNCSTKLESHQPFGLSSLQDKVLTIGCGQCALVVSRTYLLSALTIVLCIFYLAFGFSMTVETPKVYIENTWKEYIDDCGGEILLKDVKSVNLRFSQVYEGKTVNWDGFLMKATENFGWFRGEHAAVMLVKMMPSESEIQADLILSMDEEEFLRSRSELAGLYRGSHFLFNATFVSVGNEHQLHHLHAHDIRKIEGFMEISPQVHSVNHRYNLKTQTVQTTVSP